MKMPSNAIVGFLVTILAVVSLAQLLYFTHQQQEQADCVTDTNQLFLDVVKQRAAINDGDRDSIRELVNAIASTSDLTMQQEAVQKYNAQSKQLDALRESFKYPEIRGTC